MKQSIPDMSEQQDISSSCVLSIRKVAKLMAQESNGFTALSVSSSFLMKLNVIPGISHQFAIFLLVLSVFFG